MMRTRKKWILLVLVTLLAAALATGILYAVFTSDTSYPFNMDQRVDAVLTVSSTPAQQAVELIAPGAQDERKITVTNESLSDVALGYELELAVKGNSLAAAGNLILWLDGEPVGVLRQLLRASAVSGSEYSYLCRLPVDLPLAPGESRTHTLQFEYHLGAAAAGTQRVDWRVAAVGKTDVNFGKYLFVRSGEELVQIARQNKKSGVHAGKTVYLCGDGPFALGEPLAWTKGALDLDLNGRALTLNESMTYADVVGVSRIYSSRAGGTLAVAAGKQIAVASPAGLVLVDESVLPAGSGAADLVSTAGGYSADLLLEALAEDLVARTAGGLEYRGGVPNSASEKNVTARASASAATRTGVTTGANAAGAAAGAGGSYRANGAFAAYPYRLSSASDALSVGADNSFAVVKTSPAAQAVPLTLAVGGAEQVLVLRIPGADGFADAFVAQNVPYLAAADVAGGTVVPFEVSFDLFLPTLGRESGVTVRWLTSRPDLVTGAGKYRTVAENTDVDLIGLFSAGSQTVVKTFRLRVLARDPADLLREFALMKAPQFDAAGTTKTLAGDDDELAAQYRIADIVYGEVGVAGALPENMREHFKLAGLDLTMTKSPGEGVYDLTITATVGGSQGVSAALPVYVAPGGTASMVEQAHERVQEALQGRIDRLHGVELPTSFDDVTIAYRLVVEDPQSERIQGKEVRNPKGAGDYVQATGTAGEQIIVKTWLFPTVNTVVYLVAEYTYRDTVEQYVLEFPVAGVLHNDEAGIPDLTLYTALYRLYDRNGDWLLTRDEIAAGGAAVLTVNNTTMRDLSGLQYFTDLREIDLSYNRIEDVSALASCGAVSRLDLSHNRILNVEALANLTLLTNLNLSDNQITDYSALGSAAGLTALDLSNNPVSEATDFRFLEQLDELETLNLSKCFPYAEVTGLPYRYSVLAAYRNYLAKHGKAPQYTKTDALTGTASLLKPSDAELNNAAVLSGIAEVYRIGATVYLPFAVSYRGASYQLFWYAASGSESVVSIDNQNKTAVVTRPAANQKLRLYVQISDVVRRYFDVLAVPSGEDYFVEVKNASGAIERRLAETVFLDDEFRSYVFRTFDADGNRTLTRAELAAVTALNNIVGLGIADIAGIECFENVAEVNLDGNPVASLLPLAACPKLQRLTLANALYPYDELAQLPAVAEVKVYGSFALDTEEAELALFALFEAQSGKVSIYKDSLDAKWDPYENFLRRQLTRVDDVILVPAGGSATIALPASGVLYPGTAQEKTIALTFTFDTLSSTYLSLKDNVLTSTVPPAYDSYVDLRLKISCANTGFTYAKRISAVAQADFSVLVEYLDANGKTQTANLYDKVKDKTVIETLLKAYRDYKDGSNPKPTGPNGEWLISRKVIGKVTSLTFDGQSNTELMGLELFFSSNLSSLTLKNYHAVTKADGSRADFSFTRDAAFWTKLKNLRSLTFNTGVVDLFDFSVPSLTSLHVVNCLYLVMDRTMNGVTESAFAGLSALKTLDLAYNNIGNFWAVGEVPQVTMLFLYGNPGSKLVQTENYVKLAYQSAKRLDPFGAFNYRITDKDIVWLPDAQEIWIDPVVVTDSGAERALAEGSASCNVIAPNAELRLPSVYRHEQLVQGDTTDAVGTAEAKLTWTSSAPSLVEIAGAADADGRFAVRVLGAAQAYVLLTATVDGSEKTLTYALFLDGSADPFWSAFLADDTADTALADPTFAYCVYTDLHPTDGVVTEAAAAALTSFVHPDDIIADIRGIRKLTGLTALDLSENEIVDVSELFVLERLTSLKLAGNRIASLWVPASSSLAQGLETTVRVNAEGAEDAAGAYSLTVANFSLFYRMSGLTNLFVQRNPTIADYGPISFRDDRSAQTVGSPAVQVQAAARDGLKNLSKLATFPFELKNNHYNDPGDAKDIGNLKAIDPYNYFVLWYDTCQAAGKLPSEFWKYDTQKENSLDTFYKGCKVLSKLEETFYGTTAYKGNIRIQATGSTFKTKIDGLTMHYFYPDPTQATGISKEFNVDANTGAVKLTGSVAKLNHTVYLVVMVQDSQYRLVPVDITVDSAQTYWVEDADGTTRPAQEVFPDEVLRSALFFKFAVKADGGQRMTLTPTVVAAYKTSKLDLSYYGIRDLTGLDYVLQNSTVINEIALGYNAITTLPALDVPAGRSYRLDLSNCKVLEDLTGLAYSAGGAGMISLGAALNALDVTNCKSLPEAEVDRINAANCPGLLTLTVSGLHLADYSFLTRLPVGIAEVNMNYTDGVPPQLLKGHNLDAVKQLFLRTSPANGQGLDAAKFQYFGVANAPIFGEYLHFPVSYDAALPVWLPLQVTLYGTDYAIDWTGLPEKGALRTDLSIAGVTFADGIGTYARDGKRYLVFALADGNTAELSCYAQLVDGEGRKTYREKIVLNFSADVISGDVLLTDADVQRSENGAYERLSSFVPDPILRYYILQSFLASKRLKDGKISFTDFRGQTSLEIGEYVANNPNFSSGKKFGIVNSLEGLDAFDAVTSLMLVSVNTDDFSAVGRMTGLRSLYFRTCPQIADFRFMESLVNLESLELYQTPYTHLAFLSALPKLTVLTDVNNASAAPVDSAHVRNAIAYQRVFANLKDLPGTYENISSSRDDEKVGAIVLDQLELKDWHFAATAAGNQSYYRLSCAAGETLTVADSVFYNGQTAAVSLRALSSRAQVDGNSLTVSGKAGDVVAFVVRVEYEGGVYERYFEAEIA